MSFKKKKKPLPDVGPSYDDGKLSFSGREEMDDLTENEQRMLTFSEMEPVELATHFEDLLGALEDDEANVRNAALLLLRQLEPSLLARHALRISACLEDDVKQVRRTAMQTLCDLDPALLPEDATKSSGKPESDNPYRRAMDLPLVSSSHSSVSQLVRNESAMSTQKKASTT